MNTQLSLLVSFPSAIASRLELDTCQGRCDMFMPVSDALMEAGAVSVLWSEPNENVHGPQVPHSAATGKDSLSRTATGTLHRDGPQSIRSKAENVAVECLSMARRALQKEALIEMMNKAGIGLNAARKAIAKLEAHRTVCEFPVQRNGRKSAVFVALL